MDYKLEKKKKLISLIAVAVFFIVIIVSMLTMALIIADKNKKMELESNIFLDFASIKDYNNLADYANIVYLGNSEITEMKPSISINKQKIDDDADEAKKFGWSFYNTTCEMTDVKIVEIYIIVNFSIKAIKDKLATTTYAVSYTEDCINIQLGNIRVDNVIFNNDSKKSNKYIMCYIKLTN